jgi:L-iditol 2-dehydrogenase
VREYTKGGAHYVLQGVLGAPNAINDAAAMLRRGGRICLAAFPVRPCRFDVAVLGAQHHLYGIAARAAPPTAPPR